MNILNLINEMKYRTMVFVGEYDLTSIYHFINGFLYYSLSSCKQDDLDYKFKSQFHEWVRNKLEQSNEFEFEETMHSYVYYITKIYTDKKEQVNIFLNFAICFLKNIIINDIQLTIEEVESVLRFVTVIFLLLSIMEQIND